MNELLIEFLGNILEAKKTPGVPWKTRGNRWAAKKTTDGETEYFETEQQARAWLKGKTVDKPSEPKPVQLGKKPTTTTVKQPSTRKPKKIKGTLQGVGTRELFPNPKEDGLNVVTPDGGSDKPISLGGVEIGRITLDTKKLESHLASIEDEVRREEKRREILVRVETNNRKVDFIKKYGRKGIIELPKGETGASLLQDRLGNALFPDTNSPDRQEFDTLTSGFKTAKTNEEESVAWKKLHSFLQSKEFQGGVIPALCEQLKALRVMTTEPTATVCMPLSDGFPVGDVLVVRKVETSGHLEIGSVTYAVDIGSIKRTAEKSGRGGAGASFLLQEQLTVFSDDESMDPSTTPKRRSRQTLLELLKPTELSHKELDTIAGELGIEITEDELNPPEKRKENDRLSRIEACHCGDKSTSPKCTKDSLTQYKLFKKRELLFRKIYEKYVGEQGFSNTTFYQDKIKITNGKDKKAVIKPDFRVNCNKKKTSLTVYQNKCYVIAPVGET